MHPIREILIINGDMVLLNNFINGSIRIKPYDPSFSKIAASTIEPSIGASTWAFGNHR